MIDVLFVTGMHSEEKSAIKEIQELGCNITTYNIDLKGEMQAEYLKLEEALRKKTYYVMCSIDFDEILANAGYFTGTKYVSLQYDLSENALSSVYVKYVTNYVFVKDLLSYIQFRKKRIETVYYYSSDFSEILLHVISNKEQEIYREIQKLEDFRNQNGNVAKPKKREELYDSYIEEKKFWLQIKKQCLSYLDTLMSKRSGSVWEEVIVWYNRNVTEELHRHFWEFYVLRTMIQIYKKEKEANNDSGQKLSILNFGSIQELFDVYFKMIFLLRRLEYDVAVERHMEAVILIKQYGLSDIFLKYIFEKGQINNKEKIIVKLKKLWQEYNNE